MHESSARMRETELHEFIMHVMYISNRNNDNGNNNDDIGTCSMVLVVPALILLFRMGDGLIFSKKKTQQQQGVQIFA